MHVSSGRTILCTCPTVTSARGLGKVGTCDAGHDVVRDCGESSTDLQCAACAVAFLILTCENLGLRSWTTSRLNFVRDINSNCCNLFRNSSLIWFRSTLSCNSTLCPAHGCITAPWSARPPDFTRIDTVVIVSHSARRNDVAVMATSIFGSASGTSSPVRCVSCSCCCCCCYRLLFSRVSRLFWLSPSSACPSHPTQTI